MSDKTKIEIKPYLTFQSKFGSAQQKENMQCFDLYIFTILTKSGYRFQRSL